MFDVVPLWWQNGAMSTQKAMTIRLSAEQADQLETVASVENQPVSDVIRAAIASHIESVSKDEKFQEGLRERIERARGLLR
jgi:predicted transcriptional regulator